MTVRTRTGRASQTTSLVRRSAARDLLVADRPVEVDRRHLAPEMEAHRACRVTLDERTGEQVLAVVLLAVVEAPLGVDAAVDAIGEEGRAQQVDDVVAHLEDRDHGDAVEGSRVPGLAAALGVERGPVEDHGRLALVLAALDDGGVELEQVGIVAVEALGQGSCPGRRGRSPERRHVLDVLEAGAGVEHDHGVVGAQVAGGLELAEGGHAGAALGGHEEALGRGRVLDALR